MWSAINFGGGSVVHCTWGHILSSDYVTSTNPTTSSPSLKTTHISFCPLGLESENNARILKQVLYTEDSCWSLSTWVKQEVNYIGQRQVKLETVPTGTGASSDCRGMGVTATDFERDVPIVPASVLIKTPP